MTYTADLARFAATLELTDVPLEVQERAKLLLLDGLGCGVFGSRLPWTRIVVDLIAEMEPAGGAATLWCQDRRCSPAHAALANGTMVQGFELDDHHRAGILHSCSLVLPAALAVAEQCGGCDGSTFLAALIAGFEVGPRVGICMTPAHLLQGWHQGATVGTFAAAAAAGRALSLDPGQMAHAFGIAGTQSAGLMAAQFGAMVKRMHHGRSSQSGVYAALLAGRGFTGIEDVFEVDYGGFCSTFSGGKHDFNLQELTAGLGERWETLNISLKPYATNASIHTSLDAARELRRQHGFRAGDVKAVRVRASKATVEHAYWPYEPVSVTNAQMNLPFALGVMLDEGEAFIEQFTEQKIRDPRLVALARRVVVEEDRAISRRGPDYRHLVHVEIELNDGRLLPTSVESALGTPAHPLSEPEVIAKFGRLCRDVLDDRRTEALREATLQVEQLPDARELGRLLA